MPFIGTDKIDIEAASRLGILVANSPTPENFIAVAEATVALTLMLQKRIKHNEAKLRRGEWAQRGDRGEFLFGKTVGLVGLGRVGSHVARRLVNWDVRLLAADPYVSAERARVARRHPGGPADPAGRERRGVAARLADRRDARP